MIPKPNSTDPVRLPLSDGRVTLVDPDIAEALRGRHLSLHTRGYVALSIGGRHCLLHQFVAPAPPGKELDHINRDRRDNRRANLRHLTHRENIWRSRHRVGRSGYRGVGYNARCARYVVQVTWCGKTHSCRSYASALIAAFVRDDLARRVTSLDEGLNFPGRIERNALRAFLDDLGPKLFAVVFVRRSDGALRRMVCQRNLALPAAEGDSERPGPSPSPNPQSAIRNLVAWPSTRPSATSIPSSTSANEPIASSPWRTSYALPAIERATA